MSSGGGRFFPKFNLVLPELAQPEPHAPSLRLLVLYADHLGLASPVRAEVRRLAVVIGSDVGGGERPVLHFAQTDAEKFASVLVELGEFARSDVYLLKGRTVATVREVLTAASERVAIWRREDAGHRIVLLVDFRGTPTEKTSNWRENSSRSPSFGGFSRLGGRCPARDHR